MIDEYDVIVIGGGPGGEVVAGRCAQAGLSTALVERELVGGECSFWGCMPSKGLLRPGAVLAAALRVPGAYEAVTGKLDDAAALARRDEITGHYDDESHVRWLDAQGVDLVRGHGRLAGERAVEVEADGIDRRLGARRAVVVATGSSAVIPPIDGLRNCHPWDNRAATSAKEAPRRLLVLGGGAVGVEMAQAWRSLGSEEVTIIEAAERLLPMEEPFAGNELAAAFTAQGISVITGARMVAARRAGRDGPVTARLDDDHELVGDELVVAVGRRPRTAALGLETVGLEPGRPIEVDERMRALGTGGRWLYAIGDTNGRAMFTHMAKYHARVAADDIAGGLHYGPSEHLALPRVIFTDPQVAAVGLTEEQAIERGLEVGVAQCDLADTAGAYLSGRDVSGTVQLVIDERRRVLVGATFVGPDVGELLHAATVAIVGEVPVRRLRHAVAAFPSVSEVWLKAIENYDAAEQKGRRT